MTEEDKKKHLKIVKNEESVPETEEDIEYVDEGFDADSYLDYLQEQEELFYKNIKQKGNFWGIADSKGNFVIPPVYDEIQPWVHGLVIDSDSFKEPDELPMRYILYKDGKQGIASDDEVLVEPMYDAIENFNIHIDGCRIEYFPAMKDKRTYYLDNDGNVLADFDFEEPFSPVFSYLTIGFTKGEGFYVVNLKTKKIIYENTYFNVGSANVDSNPNRIMLKLNKENKFIVIDENGNIIYEIQNTDKIKKYELKYLNDKVLSYSVDDKKLGVSCGLMDTKGNILTDLKYRTINVLLKPDYDKDSYEYTDYLLCSPLVPQTRNFPGFPDLAGSDYKEITDSSGTVLKSNLYNAWGMPAPFGHNNADCLPVMYYEGEKERCWEGPDSDYEVDTDELD